MKRKTLFILLATIGFWGILPTVGQSIKPDGPVFRLWTSTAGTTLNAKFHSFSNRVVKLERDDGTLIDVPFDSLKDDDQLYVRNLAVAPAVVDKKITSLNVEGGRVDIPEHFPVDRFIAKSSFLRKQSTQPLNFSFKDSVSKKNVTAYQLRGRVLYVHVIWLASDQPQEFKELKLLFDKYASRGFDIISIEADAGPKLKGDGEERFTEKSKRMRILNYIETYDVKWKISFPEGGSANPLLLRVSNESRFGCLFGPDGKLLHTNVYAKSKVLFPADTHDSLVRLADLLQIIFPE